MAFSTLVSPPHVSEAILDTLAAEDSGAASRDVRRDALLQAAKPVAPTPVNRYWRVDFSRLDLQLDAPRPAVQPVWPALPANATGAVLCSLAEAAKSHPELLARGLNSLVEAGESRFTALAAALEQGGYFLYVPAGVVLEPLSLRFTVPAGSRWCPRTVVVLEAGASAEIYEELTAVAETGAGAEAGAAATAGGVSTLVCGTVEVQLEAQARLHIVTRQQLDARAQMFVTRRGRVAESAELHWTVVELGGALVQSTLDAQLAGRGAASRLGALIFADGEQHVDVRSEARHFAGGTKSQTIVKAAATGKGQGRFTGNIRIDAGAHQSEAALRDDALLLSEHAHIDSIPGLEIAANDVQAFHGATVGSIDKELLFYTMSRGISAAEAERMIALAFFETLLQTIPEAAGRDAVAACLRDRIGSPHGR